MALRALLPARLSTQALACGTKQTRQLVSSSNKRGHHSRLRLVPHDVPHISYQSQNVTCGDFSMTFHIKCTKPDTVKNAGGTRLRRVLHDVPHQLHHHRQPRVLEVAHQQLGRQVQQTRLDQLAGRARGVGEGAQRDQQRGGQRVVAPADGLRRVEMDSKLDMGWFTDEGRQQRAPMADRYRGCAAKESRKAKRAPSYHGQWQTAWC